MQIAQNKVAIITYTLTNVNGDVLDQANEEQPFAFIAGTGNIIPGLDEALAGKTAGDAVTTTIAPEHAYGERHDELTQTVPKEMFQGVDNVEPGMQFNAQTNQGMSVVTVTNVEGDQVTIDGNHPLAGETLNFDVKILEVRDATADELEHGHVHGPSCDH
ncbi:MAG TPA: peptidylprolyl isomerase [Candidatus Tenderia sp.]|nr:peptidylprolyl isomerase [Candidatus Tenderia sp.]